MNIVAANELAAMPTRHRAHCRRTGPAADNIDSMKKVAAKYDPSGVFQTRQPGGFKLSRVTSSVASNVTTL